MRNEELIKHLKEEGYLETGIIERAFREVPREYFVRKGDRRYAYSDEPLPIGYNQTISAPHMVAVMTELLEPKKTDIVLEVGGGSGYQAAILSKLVKKVYTIELQKELAEYARSNLRKTRCKNCEVIHGDGSGGHEKAAPYDKIIITCAVPEIPRELVQQLKEGGIIVAPVGNQNLQILVVGKKKGSRLEKREYFGCIFVPMRH